MLGKLYKNLLQAYGMDMDMDMDMNSHWYSKHQKKKREKHYIKVVLHYSERDKALDRAELCNWISVMLCKECKRVEHLDLEVFMTK